MVGCIYEQAVQRGGSSGRVQAISFLAWGWREILGRCSLVRRQDSVFHKPGIYWKSVSQFLSSIPLRAHMWGSSLHTLQFHFRLKSFHTTKYSPQTFPNFPLWWPLPPCLLKTTIKSDGSKTGMSLACSRNNMKDHRAGVWGRQEIMLERLIETQIT